MKKSDASISISPVDCLNRSSIPDKSEDIFTDFPDLRSAVELISRVSCYPRSARDCPFGRGNFMIDIYDMDGNIRCIKLPKEMEESHFFDYVRPLMVACREKDLK